MSKDKGKCKGAYLFMTWCLIIYTHQEEKWRSADIAPPFLTSPSGKLNALAALSLGKEPLVLTV
jgi:hypothetical protein